MEAGLPLASKAGPPKPGLALGLLSFGGRAQARQRHPARGYYRHAHAHGRSQKDPVGAGWLSAHTAAPSHTHTQTHAQAHPAHPPRERAGRALGGDTCTGLGGGRWAGALGTGALHSGRGGTWGFWTSAAGRPMAARGWAAIGPCTCTCRQFRVKPAAAVPHACSDY